MAHTAQNVSTKLPIAADPDEREADLTGTDPRVSRLCAEGWPTTCLGIAVNGAHGVGNGPLGVAVGAWPAVARRRRRTPDDHPRRAVRRFRGSAFGAKGSQCGVGHRCATREQPKSSRLTGQLQVTQLCGGDYQAADSH